MEVVIGLDPRAGPRRSTRIYRLLLELMPAVVLRSVAERPGSSGKPRQASEDHGPYQGLRTKHRGGTATERTASVMAHVRTLGRALRAGSAVVPLCGRSGTARFLRLVGAWLNAAVLGGLPRRAAWLFVGAVDGFEVVYFDRSRGGFRWRGHMTGLEDGQTYAVRWELELDELWRTRSVHVTNDTVDGGRAVSLSSDGEGEWTVDGDRAPHLAGLIDVDLEASACTNALPVHRLALPPGEVTAAPAVYVHAIDLAVTRLEQTYQRRDTGSFAYTSQHGTFRAVLTYDTDGLVHDYPGIARRVT